MLKFALLLLVSFVMISPASAIDKSYLGDWSVSPTCMDDEILTITPKGTSGIEHLCTTTKSSKGKKGWTLTMKCVGEGEHYTMNTTFLLLKNGRLRQTTKGRKVIEHQRCSGGQSAAPLTSAGTEAGNKLDTPWGRITQKQFANKCVECFNEAQTLRRSVGGYCPPNCAEIEMTCDNQGVCHATP